MATSTGVEYEEISTKTQANGSQIHQPSAVLFQQFDSLLLLAKGGKTVYFGDIGENSSILKDYFARNDAPCPIEANPAEHMIDVVTGPLSRDKDWNHVWLNSPEHDNMTKELDQIITKAAAKEPGTKDDGFEFAMPMWRWVFSEFFFPLPGCFRRVKAPLAPQTALFFLSCFLSILLTKGNTDSRLQSNQNRHPTNEYLNLA